jgi:bifunctional non-homologous end joining protein LigD
MPALRMKRTQSQFNRPERHRIAQPSRVRANKIQIPEHVNDADLDVPGGHAHLTNLNKVFWPQRGLTKQDLLQYYLDVSPLLLPHIQNRAMVMKRYPDRTTGYRSQARRTDSPSRTPDARPAC